MPGQDKARFTKPYLISFVSKSHVLVAKKQSLRKKLCKAKNIHT